MILSTLAAETPPCVMVPGFCAHCLNQRGLPGRTSPLRNEESNYEHVCGCFDEVQCTARCATSRACAVLWSDASLQVNNRNARASRCLKEIVKEHFCWIAARMTAHESAIAASFFVPASPSAHCFPCACATKPICRNECKASKERGTQAVAHLTA